MPGGSCNLAATTRLCLTVRLVNPLTRRAVTRNCGDSDFV